MAGVGRAAREHRRALSQGMALPDAKSLYRDLLRTVRAFPAEPMLDLNDAGTEQAFAVVATLQAARQAATVIAAAATAETR